MKIFTKNLFTMLALLAGINQAAAQGTTAFTYQGQLRDSGTNASGTYNMTFKLYDAVSGGIQIGSAITNSPTLANGLFTVNLDFGADAFNGTGRWLDITAQSGTDAPETLTPRVQILPTPYAIFAATAASVTNGAIRNAQLAGNAVNTTNIQTGAITTMQIAAGAVTNANLTANAVATANIQNDAVTDAKIVSVSGSKVSSGVALATNAYYANELQTSILTGVDPVVRTFWDVYAAGVAGPGIVPHDLVFSANGAAQMVIRPNGQGTLVNASVIGPWTISTGAASGISGSLEFYNGGDLRMVIAPTGAVTGTGGQNGMLILGQLSIQNGELNLHGGAVSGVSGLSAAGGIINVTGNVEVSGVVTAMGFASSSDRNLKEKFIPIDNQEILARVIALPISSWNFKTEGNTRHIGPMAQDFYSAFNVGTDDKHIATVDEGGVALAAIQGLNEKLKEKDVMIEAMEKRLADLEELIKSSTHK